MGKTSSVNRLGQIGKPERRVSLPGGPAGPVSWRNVDTGVLVETLQMVSLAGGALRLGFTRDGGAFAVGVYGDGDPYTVYCSPSQNMADFLRAIRDGFEIIGNTGRSGGTGA